MSSMCPDILQCVAPALPLADLGSSVGCGTLLTYRTPATPLESLPLAALAGALFASLSDIIGQSGHAHRTGSTHKYPVLLPRHTPGVAGSCSDVKAARPASSGDMVRKEVPNLVSDSPMGGGRVEVKANHVTDVPGEHLDERCNAYILKQLVPMIQPEGSTQK